jgi:hypothetical protein
MTQQQLDLLRQQLGYSNPGIEPPPLPSPTPGGYNYPHEAVNAPPSVFQGNYFPPNVPHSGFDVPPGVFPDPTPDVPGQVNIFSETNPPNVTYPPNFWGGELPPINTNDPTRNIPINETMYPDGKYYLGDPDTSYATQPGFNEDPFPDFPNEPPPDYANEPPPAGFDPIQNPQLTNDTMRPNEQGGYFPPDLPPDYSSTTDPGMITGIQPLPPDIYQQIWGWEDQPNAADAGSSAPGTISYDDTGTEPVNRPFTPPSQPYQYPFYVNQFPGTSATGELGTGGGGNQSASGGDVVTRGSPGMIGADGKVIPGTETSQSDEAAIRNFERNPPPIDPRYSWHDAFHPGQTMVKLMSDGTRVLVDAAGNIIKGGIQAGEDLYHNIMNDPRNTDPAYLTSIGYREGQGDKSLFPSQVTGPTAGPYDVGDYGVGGQGGSFFHDTTLTNAGTGIFDRGPSTMNPGGYNFPVHGATSVAGASAGGMGPITNANALGSRSGALSPLDRAYLMRLRKGIYTTPNVYGEMKGGAPSPFPNTPSPVAGGSNWNAFHAGQVQLGDILRANPAYYNSLTAAMPKTGQGPGVPGQRATRGLPPTLPT